jgi:hypothetical protein
MIKLFRRAKNAFHLQWCQQQRDAVSATDERRTRTGTSRAEKIKTICDLGKIHTISMRDGSLDPKRLANERKNYEMYMREAVALVRRVTDPVLRDRSVSHIIDLCINGGEEGQATVLLGLVQSDFVRREIAGKHPQLAVKQSRQSLLA